MAFTVSPATTGFNASAVATMPVTLPANVAGDLLFVLASTKTLAAPWGATPAGWTAATHYAGNVTGLQLFYKLGGGAEPNPSFPLATADRYCYACVAIGGADQATPVNTASGVTANNTTASLNQTLPSVTPANAGALIVWSLGLALGTGNQYTATAPTIESADLGNTGSTATSRVGLWAGYEVLATGAGVASGTRTLTGTTSLTTSVRGIAINPATAPPPPTATPRMLALLGVGG